MSLGFFFEASSLSHSLSNFSDRLSAESAEGIWYISDNSRRCLYPFLKIGLVQLKKKFGDNAGLFQRRPLHGLSGAGVSARADWAQAPNAKGPITLGACRSTLFL